LHEELDTHHKSLGTHKQSTPRAGEGLPAGAARLGRAALQNHLCSMRRPHCRRGRHCAQFVVPTCEHNVTAPVGTGSGIGNLLPLYGAAAAKAFARGCTVRLVGAPFQQSFLVPQLLPATPEAAAAEVVGTGARAVADGYCVLRALTHRPSEALAQQVARVHTALATTDLTPGRPRASVDGDDCCRPPKRALVAMHVRTMWADNRVRAESYRCARPTPEDRRAAANELHALFVPPRAIWAGAAPPPLPGSRSRRAAPPQLHGSPTLASMVDEAIHTGERWFGAATPLSLFVASDSPATRETAVALARQRGIWAAHSQGSVRHSGRDASKCGTEPWARAKQNASVDCAPMVDGRTTAMTDLVLLSEADVLVAFTQGSTFPSAAAYMARCNLRQLRPPVYYQMLQKLARALYRFMRNDSYAEQAARRAWSDGPHCLRDCLLVDPVAPRNNETALFGLLTYVRGGTIPAVSRMSSACLHACACWVQAGLG